MFRFFFIPFYLLGQTCLAQFQVLEARNSFINDEPILALDTLPESGGVRIEDQGFLSLVHRSGRCLEYVGEDRLVLDSGNWKNLKSDYSIPSLKELFKPTITTGSVMAGLPELETMYGNERKPIKLGRDQRICLKWKTRNPSIGKFMLSINNIFDEPLADSIAVVGYDYELDLKEIEFNQPPEENLVIVYVEQREPYWHQEMAITLILSDEQYLLPDQCSPKTATETVLMAYFLEKAGMNLEALTYYEKATQLSKEQVFQNIHAQAQLRLNY